MADGIEVHVLDAARILVPDQTGQEIVLHMKTVSGHDFHFGASVDDAVRLVVQWFYELREIHQAREAGTEIVGETEKPKLTVN